MANPKIQISTANSRKKNRHFLPTTTLLTSDVAQITPVNILPTTPGDVFNIDFSHTSQSVPTAVKTFGAFHIRNFAFFVPHRVVYPKFEEYIAQSVDSSLDINPVNYYISQMYFVVFGIELSADKYTLNNDTAYSKAVTIDPSSPSDAHKFDFYFGFVDESSLYNAAKLTAKGRALFKILDGLGYNFPRMISSAASWSPLSTTKFDILPLLSFARFFYDYVYPSSYVSQQGFGFLFDGVDGYTYASVVPKLLDLFFVPMEQDFFTSLWLRPNQKALGSSALGGLSYVQGSAAGSPILSVQNRDTVDNVTPFDSTVLQQSASNRASLSASSLRWLEAISDYVIRNNIGGQRFHEWMKAHFGFVTAPEDSVRSVFLKSWNDTLSFSGVVASTGTSSQLLGDRAAIGNCQGGGKLKFECKEHGFLIFAQMVVPSTAYYQGVKPWCRELKSPYQFYTPELDSVDMEPVPVSAVYGEYNHLAGDSVVPTSRYNDAFGFCPRYAEKYKVGHSYVLGDFRLNSRNTGMDAYHTFRNVLYGRSSVNQLALDAQFMQADNQYDRIYAVAPEAQEGEQLQDKIESLYLFNVVKYSSQLSIGDSMPIFDKSGRDVNLENGGTQI